MLGGVIPSASTATAPPAPRHVERRVQSVRRPPHAKREASFPLATTITRIVGVIPTGIWIVIAILAALALALAGRSWIIGLRARRLERQRAELLEDVGLLQAALLPSPPTRLGAVASTVAYRPADGPAAGGDFYDVFELEAGEVAVIVGDLSGHGRHALPHTALVRFTLRAYLEAGMSPRSALQIAAAVLERQLAGGFATVVIATYRPKDGILAYASAGHPPPLVLGRQDFTPVTVCSSPPIGAGLPTGMRQTTISLIGETTVCLYTDGVVEARVAGSLYGSDRLERTLSELPADAPASALLDRVAQQADQRPDDMAACVLRIGAGDQAPGIRIEELELDAQELERERAGQFLIACGVSPHQAAQTLRAARQAVQRNGNVVLELRLGDGPPEVALRERNVAVLQRPPLVEPMSSGAQRA